MTDASLSSVIERDASLLLLVDLQEKLLRAVRDHERVVARCALLLQAAARLNVPVLATEQYAKGIGATHPALAALLPPNAVMDKIHFSCVAEADCTHSANRSRGTAANRDLRNRGSCLRAAVGAGAKAIRL